MILTWTGQFGFGDTWKWIGKHSDAIGAGLTIAGAGACMLATAGFCTAAVIATAALGGVTTTAGARHDGSSWGKAITKGTIDASIGLAGARGAKAVRWFGNNRNYTTVAKALSKAAGKARAKTLIKDVVKDQVRSRAIDYAWKKTTKRWR